MNSIRDERGYTLYVGDIPNNLTKDGLRTMFENYGEITHILMFKSENYAFVSFSTYGEAEKAIQELNNKLPLNLKVEFSMKKQANGANDMNEIVPVRSESSEINFDHRYYKSKFTSTGSVPRIQELVQRLPPQVSATDYGYTPGGYIPVDSNFYDPYDELEHKNAVELWSRGIVTVDIAGRRHVTAGRGFTMYHLPEPYPRVERDLHFVYEARNRDSYVYGVDEMKDKVGNCLHCGKAATNNCASCMAFYCSRECQVTDWPKHQTTCKQIPSLLKNEVKLNDTVESVNTKTKIQKINDECVNNRNENDRKFTPDLHKRLENCRISVQQTERQTHHYEKKTFLPLGEYVDVQIAVIHEPGLFSVRKASDKKQLAEIMHDLNQDTTELKPVTDFIVGKMYGSMYKNLWHRATILTVNPVKIQFSDYGNFQTVHKPDFRDIGKFKEIPPLADIIKIVSDEDKYKNLTENMTIKIKLLKINSNDIHEVELFMDKLVPAAKIIHRKPVEYNQNGGIPKQEETITAFTSVRPVTPVSAQTSVSTQPPRVPHSIPFPVATKDSAVVEHSKPQPQSVPAPKMETIPSYLEAVTESTQLIVTIAELTDQNSGLGSYIFNSVLPQYEQLLDPLTEDCEAIKSQFLNYRPTLNELVCIQKSDGGWYRGRIVGLNPLKMASLDEGLIIPVIEVIPMPEKYKKIGSFSGIIKANVPLAKDMAVPSIVKSKKMINGELIVTIVDEATMSSEFELREWNPIGDSKTHQFKVLAPSEVKHGSKVILVSHRGASIVFIRSVEPKENERYAKLIQDVAKASLTAPKLSKMPEPGTLVLAQFIDGNFYRAIILNTSDGKIKIGYIDYGNNELTTLDKLRVMPDFLKDESRISVKVELKGINKEIPPTELISDYIDTLVAKETVFTCTFDGSIKDGVTLTSDKDCLNECINEFLNESYKKANKEKDKEEEEEVKLTLTDIESAKIGKVGETVQVLLFETISSGYLYALAPYDSTAITYICEELILMLQKYAESTQHYIPVKDELCIAKFDNGWYRACCINSSSTPTTANLFFVDFGNIADITHTDIRQMIPDFLKPAALCTVASAKDLVPSKGEPSAALLEKLKTLLVQNEQYSVKIVEYNPAQDELVVEFPEIHNQLVAEGLL